jgi:hypothetical protein
MMLMHEFREIKDAPRASAMLTSALVQSGPPIAPLARIMGYDSAEWERFIEEWVAHCLKPQYTKVMRAPGANDRGIDIAAFTNEKHLLGVWDNYQCKHYDHGIMPSEAWPEIGKMLWHSFNGHFVPPRAYYFVAPRSVGMTLSQLLSNTPALKAALIKVWPKNVQDEITSKQSILLEDKFAEYVDQFDFSIFKPPLSPRELIEQHRSSPYFISRFGGGLPARPVPESPPEEIHVSESGYVTQLLAAYADHTKKTVADIAALKAWQSLANHFSRQRESFYHAESFRIFVRDKVEPGTFEGLQEEIYHGVVDTCDGTHADGFERVKAVTEVAQSIALDAHPLGPSALVKDRRGICHQLANEDRLKWTK